METATTSAVRPGPPHFWLAAPLVALVPGVAPLLDQTPARLLAVLAALVALQRVEERLAAAGRAGLRALAALAPAAGVALLFALLVAPRPSGTLSWLVVYVYLAGAALQRGREAVVTVAVVLAAGMHAAWRVADGQEGAVPALIHAILPPFYYLFLSSYARLSQDVVTVEREAAKAAERARAQAARTALARLIHDGVGASLTGAVLQGEVARLASGDDPDRARVALGRVEVLLERASRELSTIAGPLTGEAPGAQAAEHELRSLADALFVGSGTCAAVVFELPGSPPWRADQWSALRCALHEALANVARHARSSIVEVSLRLHGADVVVVIEDDGIGVEHSPLGFGAESLRAHAGALGGCVRWEAGEDGGTRVTLTFPAQEGGPDVAAVA